MTKNKIRICFVTQYLSIGGIETRLLKLLRAIDLDKYEPVLLCARDDGLQAEAFKKLGVQVITSPGLLPVNRLIQYWQLIRLLAQLRFQRFDIILSFLATSMPFENALARFGVKNKGAFIFGLVINFAMGRSKDWGKRTRLARNIISVSKGSAEAVFDDPLTIAKVEVIYNGVDTHLFNKMKYPEARNRFGLEDKPFVIACVARLAPQKRYDVLLNALELLKEKGVSYHCLIAGQDRLDGWLQKTIVEKKLANFVTYLGPSDNVPELLAACDAFVLTSDNEGCPNVVLEAMATGIPVVVTKSGSEEFVINGKNGFVVELEDAEGIADSLETLANNDSVRLNMGAYARDWVRDNASLAKMLNSYFSLFEEIIANNHKGAC